MSSDGIWRWNVDDVWQSYSSMLQESFFAENAAYDITRYHHLTACLLFGGCAVESFMNTSRRRFLEGKGLDTKTIHQELRYTSLRKKMEEWPYEICKVKFEPNDLESISGFLDLRNEVTHRKRRDHSLYKELDESKPSFFVQAVQNVFVAVYTGLNNSFPYWLLGWNFVGMNGDEAHPCLINNQQFKHALAHMGFPVPAWEYHAANAWEEENMKGIAAFHRLKSDFYNNAPTIEPRIPMFPMAPRLCKHWWDRELIYNS